jgi:lipoprotein-anchoring transpeptidase ErfK/SrfK
LVVVLLAGLVVAAATWHVLHRPAEPAATPVVAVAPPEPTVEPPPPAAPAFRPPQPADSAVPAASPAAPTAAAPVPAPAPIQPEANFRPRMPRDVFEAQIALSRDAICPGAIDGAYGGQTRAALVAFQQKHGLRVTGQLDNTTRAALELKEPPLASYTVTADDFMGLRPASKGWLERAALDRLGFSSILELVAERHCAHPNQIKRLNPNIDWQRVVTGTVVVVPRVERRPPATLPALVVIHLGEKTLEVFDAESRLLAHFPCSIARRVEKRPVGRLEVVVFAKDPNYTFDPETFPDSPEARAIGRKLILQPGPNNPVGVAWIGLSLSGYGIHGTPEPEQVGRTESSGCFRLANWNAAYLLPLVRPGLPVQVEP